MDLRKKARVPYEYRIIGGRAMANQEEALRLTQYFQYFLEGFSMTEAAKKAGLVCSAPTLPQFFFRKEYCGTDYYPALITNEYQKMLQEEWAKRRERRGYVRREKERKSVRVYTQFYLAKQREEKPKSAAEYLSLLYQDICPRVVKEGRGSRKESRGNQKERGGNRSTGGSERKGGCT